MQINDLSCFVSYENQSIVDLNDVEEIILDDKNQEKLFITFHMSERYAIWEFKKKLTAQRIFEILKRKFSLSLEDEEII